MSDFGSDNSSFPSHLQEVGEGLTPKAPESKLERARRMVEDAMNTVITERPKIEEFDTPAPVVPISEAPSVRRERAAAEAIASAKAERLAQAKEALERAEVNNQGEVVDMAKYRQIEAARQEVADSYPTTPHQPEPQQLEDLFKG